MDLRGLLEAGDRRRSAAAPPSEIGVVVTAPVAGVADVNVSGSVESVAVASGLSLAMGDTVVVLRARQCSVVIAELPLAASPTPPVSPVDPAPSSGTAQFPAVGSYSWQSPQVTWTPDSVVRQGSDGAVTWTGAWFYTLTPGDGSGTGPVGASTLSGTTITGCRVWVHRSPVDPFGAVSTVRLHLSSLGAWPPATDTYGPVPPVALEAAGVGVTPSPTEVTADLLPGEGRWVELPASWGQLFVSGYGSAPTGPGLMVVGSTPVLLLGIEDDPESGLLQLDWVA